MMADDFPEQKVYVRLSLAIAVPACLLAVIGVATDYWWTDDWSLDHVGHWGLFDCPDLYDVCPDWMSKSSF